MSSRIVARRVTPRPTVPRSSTRTKVPPVAAYDLRTSESADSDYEEIHIWGLTQESQPALIRVIDYHYSCYLRLPQIVAGRTATWNEVSAKRLGTLLSQKLKNDAPKQVEFVHKQLLYFYQGKRQIPLLKCDFANFDAMKHCVNLVKSPKCGGFGEFGTLNIEIYEHKITSIRRLFTQRSGTFTQWFESEGDAIAIGDSRRIAIAGNPEFPILEYIIDWRSMTFIDPKVSKFWVTQPRIVAFDIETYSPVHRAMPKALEPAHVSYAISLNTNGTIKDPKRRRYKIVMGKVQRSSFPDTIEIMVETENELMSEFARLMNQLDPDLIIGYNIMGYDYPYLDKRLGPFLRMAWPQMGRLEGRLSTLVSKGWSSSAYGDVELAYLDMPGRVNIDLLPFIKRDYKLDNYRLETVSQFFLGKGKHPVTPKDMFISYELSTLARRYTAKMHDKVMRMPIPGLRLARNAVELEVELSAAEYEQLIDVAEARMTIVTDYCVQDSELCIDLFEKLNMWISLTEMSSISGVTILELFTRGQQICCEAQLFVEAQKRNVVLHRLPAEPLHYSGGTVTCFEAGFHEWVLSFDFNSMYPNNIIARNMCYTTLVLDSDVRRFDPRDLEEVSFTQEEPKSRVGYVDPDKIEDDVDLKDFVIRDVESKVDENDTTEKERKKNPENMVTTRHTYYFVKKHLLEGLLPAICRRLIAERNYVRKVLMFDANSKMAVLRLYRGEIPLTPESIKDTGIYSKHITDFESIAKLIPEIVETQNVTDQVIEIYIDKLRVSLIVYDKRQLALKVRSNSMYGFTGARVGLYPCIQIAMCVTGYGRVCIETTNQYLVDTYQAKLIYNDTDSARVQLPFIEHASELKEWGDRIAKEISSKPPIVDADGREQSGGGLFPYPIAIEHEYDMTKFVLKKKMYAFLTYDKDGAPIRNKDGSLKMSTKGIVTARREHCKLLHRLYKHLLDQIMNRASVFDALNDLYQSLICLVNNEYDPRKYLTMINSINSNYKSNTFALAIFAKNLAAAGKPPAAGERISYVIVKPDPKLPGDASKYGNKLRDIEMWEISNIGESSEVSTLPQLEESLANKLRLEIKNTPFYGAESLDYHYYIFNKFSGSLDSLFEAAYGKQLRSIFPADNMFGYKDPSRTTKVVPITQPVAMFGKFYEMLDRVNTPPVVAIQSLLEYRDIVLGELKARL